MAESWGKVLPRYGLDSTYREILAGFRLISGFALIFWNKGINSERMAPHQEHYRAKMREMGWMDEAGNLIWPPDLEGRRRMARGLFGMELVSRVDYWTLLAEDELAGTDQAPWASEKKNAVPERPEVARRRKIFKTLSSEQREAARELIRRIVKGQLHSFCVTMDQTPGEANISLEKPADGYGERLVIHSPRDGELKHEQFQWLETFSIVFGKNERT
jgi:hypothetical protein